MKKSSEQEREPAFHLSLKTCYFWYFWTEWGKIEISLSGYRCLGPRWGDFPFTSCPSDLSHCKKKKKI